MALDRRSNEAFEFAWKFNLTQLSNLQFAIFIIRVGPSFEAIYAPHLRNLGSAQDVVRDASSILLQEVHHEISGVADDLSAALLK